MPFLCLTPILLRARVSITEFIQWLREGRPEAWAALALLVGCISFFALYKRITGRDFVKSRQERRAARNRRKVVLWEYRRDRDGD